MCSIVLSSLDPLFMSIAEDYINTSRDKGASRQGTHTCAYYELTCEICGNGWVEGGRLKCFAK